MPPSLWENDATNLRDLSKGDGPQSELPEILKSWQAGILAQNDQSFCALWWRLWAYSGSYFTHLVRPCLSSNKTLSDHRKPSCSMSSMTGDPYPCAQPAEISRFLAVQFADHVLHIIGGKSEDTKTSDIFSLKRAGSWCYAASRSVEFSLSNRVLAVEIEPVLTNLCQ